MVEALLLAIELNGQQLSRGALVQPLSAGQCLVETAVLAPVLSPEHRSAFLSPADPGQMTVGDPRGRCEIERESGLARLTIPAQFLKTQPIVLGQPPRSKALLQPLFGHRGDSASSGQSSRGHQTKDTTDGPMLVALPSLAVDLLAGTGSQAIGLIGSRGPHQIQLRQSWTGGQSATRSAWESILPNESVLTLGDQSQAIGPAELPTEWRGLSWSSHHPALVGTAKARGEFEVQSPARVRFFDEQGLAVFSDRLLPPGRYSLEGFGASSRPGILRLEVTDLDGERSEIELPWVATPHLLDPGQDRWQLLIGEHQQASYRRGLNLQETIRAGF